MRWRIYYDDGSVFTDQDGSPWDAPRTGVQAIAQPNDRVGWYILHSADAYYFEASREGWSKADEYTKWDHLCRARYPLLDKMLVEIGLGRRFGQIDVQI